MGDGGNRGGSSRSQPGYDASAGASVGSEPSAAWLRDGFTIYALAQDGWRRGEPIMTNLWSAHVQGGLADDEERERVARLIVSAPVLLGACKRLIEAMEMQEGREAGTLHLSQTTMSVFWAGAKGNARAAISKALGPSAHDTSGEGR